MGVHDLDAGSLFCRAQRVEQPEVARERLQDPVRASHRVCALENVQTDFRSASRQCRGTHPRLCRRVSRDGDCSTHLARAASRHRCLSVGQSVQAFCGGMKAPPACSTLAHAPILRDWRIDHAEAKRLIVRASALYANEPSVLDFNTSVYPLRCTAIDLRLSLFDWAPLGTTMAAIKLHTVFDLRGLVPALDRVGVGLGLGEKRAFIRLAV